MLYVSMHILPCTCSQALAATTTNGASASEAQLPTMNTFDGYSSRGNKPRTSQALPPASTPHHHHHGSGKVSGHEADGELALRDYVGNLLKPAHRERKITSDQYKELREKVVSKVCVENWRFKSGQPPSVQKMMIPHGMPCAYRPHTFYLFACFVLGWNMQVLFHGHSMLF